ncbi:hypothetical protein [Luteimonas sp. R10]|uniref:hypothetical protein n=1 Tax=Luteimonas sp. R10 TaxID=3108176 RepID=UPI00308BB2A4|nr:hypothetical protein U3649_14435 [Luteimonas sp. R10]
MATAGSVVIDLLARTGSFETDLKRSEKRMRDMGKAAKQVGAVVGAAFVTVGAATASAVKSAIDAADEMGKLAQRAGIAVESLTRLDYAAKLSDVSLASLSTAVQRLGQNQLQALKPGSEQARLFEKLGIAARDATTGGLRDAEAVLKDLAAQFKAMPDGADKTAIAVKLLGRSGAELIPLLNLGADGLQKFADKADRVGYTLDRRTTDAAEKFNDTLSEAKLAIDGMWRDTLPALLPKLQDFADLIGSDDFREGFATIVTGLATMATKALEAAGAIGTFAGKYNSFLADRGFLPANDNRSVEQLETRRKKLEEALGRAESSPLFFGRGTAAKLREELSEVDALIKGYPFRNVTGGVIRPTTAPAGGGTGGGSSRRDREMPDFAKDATAELQRLIEMEENARRQFHSLAATLAGPVADANYQYATDLERLRELAREGAIGTDQLTKAEADLADQHQLVMESIDARLNPGRELLKDLQFELELMKMTNAERATSIQLRGMDAEQVAKYGNAIAETNRMIEDSLESTRMLDGIRGEFEGFFSDVLSGNKGILDSFEDLLEGIGNMITQRIAQNWVDQLFGQSGQAGGGSWGDAVGSLLGVFSGRASFAGALSNGAPVGGSACY